MRLKEMMKKRIFWILVIVLGLNLLVGSSIIGQNKIGRDIYESLDVFNQAFNLLQRHFVDIDDVGVKDLIYGAIEGMIRRLDDPHTRFMNPDIYREMKVETKGSFGGLGIEIAIRDDQLTIISPLEDTPAFRAGVEAGDKIVKIDGVSTKGITLMEAVRKLRGPKGTKVTITVAREGVEGTIDFTITRDIIHIKSVKFANVQDKIGYVRIVNFSSTTGKDLKKALKTLKTKGAESLILDLRRNPGGLLTAAVEVADEFLDKGMIVTTRGRTEAQVNEFRARSGGEYTEGPLIVMIDEGSASASEIVAGAIKDNKRGLILGMKSFGKGSVQTVYDLPDNSAIAVTTAKYFTPSGKSIHKAGIEVDVSVKRPRLKKQEIEMLRKFRKEKYAEKFLSKHLEYTEDEFNEFLEALREDGIDLSANLIKSEVLREKRRKKKEREPIYDLLVDTQLKRAIDILLASQMLFERQ
jgi:carboxyl-terminal processing protease